MTKQHQTNTELRLPFNLQFFSEPPPNDLAPPGVTGPPPGKGGDQDYKAKFDELQTQFATLTNERDSLLEEKGTLSTERDGLVTERDELLKHKPVEKSELELQNEQAAIENANIRLALLLEQKGLKGFEEVLNVTSMDQVDEQVKKAELVKNAIILTNQHVPSSHQQQSKKS